MSRIRYCWLCRAPLWDRPAYCCAACQGVLDRTAYLSGQECQERPPDHEQRLERYAARAEKGEPLFE